MLMSSPISGQWIPSGDSSICDLCSAVAANRRGYHQSGVEEQAAVGQGHSESDDRRYLAATGARFNFDLKIVMSQALQQ